MNYMYYYKHVLCILLSALCINRANCRPKRDVGSNSCLVLNGVANNSTYITFEEAKEDITRKMVTASNDAKITKEMLLTDYSPYFAESETINMLDLFSFMDRESMVDLKTSVEEKVETLKLHYVSVAEHIAYVNATRTHGTMASRPADETLMEKLRGYQRSLAECLCSIRIALITAGFLETVPVSYTIVEDFHQLTGIIEHEAWRVYIVLGDGLEMSSILNEAYQLMTA